MRSFVLLAASLVAGAFAAPLQVEERQTAAWTIRGFTRLPDATDSTTTWSFTIDDGAGNLTPCTEVVVGKPSSQTNGGPVNCGAAPGPVYTVTSGWSGVFGVGNGFTTFSVVNYAANLIVFPSYADLEFLGGPTITKDKVYTPQPRV